jgi:LPS sulfotransferase NodH
MPTSPTAEIFLDAVREKGIETALFLASDFRTGSTLIGKLLEMQTGLPFQRESFNTVPTWHVMQDAPLRRAVLEALGPVRFGSMAAKLMWPHRNNLARVLGCNTADTVPNFREIFPRARFVHVARRDKVAQAVSFHMARHSNVWSSLQVARDPGGPVSYNFAEINHYFMHFIMFETLWSDFLSATDPDAPLIYYEDLLDDVAGHVELSMAHLGLDFDRTRLPADLPFERQSGDQASSFCDRFRADLSRYSPVEFLPGRLIGPPTP